MSIDSAPLIGMGYAKPLYLQSIYQKKSFLAYENNFYNENIVYCLEICPIVEKIHLIKYSII